MNLSAQALSTHFVPFRVEDSRSRKDIKIPEELNDRIESLSSALGIKTKSKTVEFLLDDLAKKNPTLVDSKVATFSNVMNEEAPVVIYGLPGSGKSFTLRRLVLEATQSGMSSIVIDIANEHLDLGRKISAASAVTRRFKQGIYRIVPEKDPRTRQFSIQRVFDHLTTLAFRGRLREFFVAIDEGYEIKEIKELYNFLIESRKFVRKAIVVSADPEPYSKICVSMRPYPKSIVSEGVSQ